jgi:hypothetical protein
MQSQRQVNTGFVARPELQFVAVVDPNRDSQNYPDWTNFGNRDRVRRFIQEPTWCEGDNPAFAGRGGRDVARNIMETYYKKQNRPSAGIRSYEDYREMLEKETDIQGIVAITPDHQHASINIAALKKGKAAIAHKPVALLPYELRRTLEASKAGSAGTHLLAYSNTPDRHTLEAWIKGGAIGTVREVHNWTERPVLAAGMAGVLQDGSPVPGRLQLDAVAGPAPRSSVPSRLHALPVSRLVRLRRRLSRRHGSVFAVAAVSHPRARRAGVGRARPSNDAVGERDEASATGGRVSQIGPAQGEHAPLAPSRDRRRVRRSTRSGTTAA